MALAKATLAPDFTLPFLEGVQCSLSAQLYKAPIVLFFFKTTCPVCQLASPFIERLSKSGAPVFGICQDLNRTAAQRFVYEYKLSFPVMIEQPGYDVSNRYGLEAVPTLFVLDADRTILHTVESFDKAAYENVATTLKVSSPFFVQESVPVYRPG